MINYIFALYSNVFYILLIFAFIYCLVEWGKLLKNRNFGMGYEQVYGTLDVKQLYELKQKIRSMEGREFEEFCYWLFKQCGKYTDVELTQESFDGGKDLILDNKVYVECKRYQDKTVDFEEYMIGREICQKLIGAMLADGIKEGLIITTGNIHQNAWDYIYNLEKNSDLKLEIWDLNDIMNLIKEINNSEVLSIIGLV